MSYKWKQVIKDNQVTGTVVYNLKHGFPAARQIIRLARVKRLKASGDYDRYGVSRFLGIHNLQACVIIGNGPSVRTKDLEAMQSAGFCTFGANRISDVFDRTSWRPTYMCAMEHGFLNRLNGEEEIEHYVLNLHKQGVATAFLNDEFRRRISNPDALNTATFVRCPLAPLYTTVLMPFSEDVALYVSDLGSVTHFAIQIACYMGFKRIYLYGVDNTYGKYLGKDGVFHVHEQASSHTKGLDAVRDDTDALRLPKTKAEAYCMGGFADLRKSEIGYRMCQEFAENRGIKILNATRGGSLEVFDRVDLDEVLSKGGAHVG